MQFKFHLAPEENCAFLAYDERRMTRRLIYVLSQSQKPTGFGFRVCRKASFNALVSIAISLVQQASDQMIGVCI